MRQSACLPGGLLSRSIVADCAFEQTKHLTLSPAAGMQAQRGRAPNRYGASAVRMLSPRGREGLRVAECPTGERRTSQTGTWPCPRRRLGTC